MRVLIDIASLNRGGAERQVVQLASGLVAEGHDVLLVVNKSIGAYEQEIISGDVRAIELGRESRWDARVLADLSRLIARFGPDCCLCVNSHAALWGRTAAVLAGRPVVIAEHSTQVRTSARIRLTNKALSWATSSAVACARGQVSALVRGGMDPSRIVVIHNAVDADAFSPDKDAGMAFRQALDIPDDACVVGLVGGHRIEKRHDRFIAVMNEVATTVPGVYGVMVGGGPLEARHRELAAVSSVADRLVFAGWQAAMSPVYNALDVVVLTSDTETFPLCFLEAQACGVPVVGMDVGGVGETFLPEMTGCLVGAGDIDAMAARLVALSVDPHERTRMGLHARQYVLRERTPARMVSEYLSVLTAAIHGGPPGSREA